MSILSALSLIFENPSHDITTIFKAFWLVQYRNSEITVDGLPVVDEVVHDTDFQWLGFGEKQVMENTLNVR